ncbi:MAG: hypothetical protein JOZ60_05875 [Verrucomicrobia bacterium]|nr:hypothetical protein [Verrucomicrobiota bacterium]
MPAEIKRWVGLTLPELRVQVLSNGRGFSLSGQAIRIASHVRARRRLIDRFFSVPSLESVNLDTRAASVRLEFADRSQSVSELLSKTASAMRGRTPAVIPLLHDEIIVQRNGPSTFEVRRFGAKLTLWRIDSPSPRVYKLTHPLLRSESIRREVLNELGTIPDVVYQSFSLLLSGGDSLLVFVRPYKIEATLFPDVLDPVLTRCLSSGAKHFQTNVTGLMVNANLALAPVADFLFPPL